MFTIRTAARAAFVAAAVTVTAVAAEKPKPAPAVKPSVQTIKSPRDVATGQASGVVKPVGSGSGVSAQKVDGWGLAKGILNIPAGAIKVVGGKVDAGVDQIKHGTEQIKASTDKDPTNDPSQQPKGNDGKSK